MIEYQSGSIGRNNNLAAIGNIPQYHGRYAFAHLCLPPVGPNFVHGGGFDPSNPGPDPCLPCGPPAVPKTGALPPTATFVRITIAMWGEENGKAIASWGNWVWTENLLTGTTHESGPFPTGPFYMASDEVFLSQVFIDYSPPTTSITQPEQAVNPVYDASGNVNLAATQTAIQNSLNSSLANAHALLGV